MLSCKTRKVKHRAATALRMGANSLCRAKGYFGEFFRRMRAKLGTAQARPDSALIVRKRTSTNYAEDLDCNGCADSTSSADLCFAPTEKAVIPKCSVGPLNPLKTRGG